MDTPRGLSRIGQENPSVPLSPELDDQLFQTYFDWNAYLDDTEPWDKQSHRPAPQNLEKLITDIPPLIDSIESHRFFRMGTSFGSDDGAVTSPDFSGHPSPPELIQGEGSTSPSDHSGPILPEQVEDGYHGQRSAASLRDFRSHDDRWTYPQAYPPSKATPPTLLRVTDADGRAHQRGHAPGGRDTSAAANHGKRPRQLENPDQTADVRKSGACLPCRISKTRVSAPRPWIPVLPFHGKARHRRLMIVLVSRERRLPHVQEGFPRSFASSLRKEEPRRVVARH